MKFYLGTWQVAPSDGFWTDQDLSESEKTISSAMKLGIGGFDTAQSYGKGRAEQTLAKILRRSLQVRFPIDTKIMPSTKNVTEILRVSLERLSPFSIDCLYLHWPKSGFNNLDFLKKMSELKDRGLINKLGVCNLPLQMLEQLVAGGLEIDRIQRPVSLLWTRELDQTLSFCRENSIELAAYSPTGMGLLSGKYSCSNDLQDGRAGLFCFHKQCYGAFLDLLNLLKETAGKHETTCTKIALSWVCAKEPDIVLIGARNPKQLKENLSERICLSESEICELDQLSRRLETASLDVCDNIFSYCW